MPHEEDDPKEICRQCGGAGCSFCGGEGEVPYGTFRKPDEDFDLKAFVRKGLRSDEEQKKRGAREAEEWLRRAIADALEKYVRPRLPEFEGYKLTLLARIDGQPEADVVVTEDDRAGLFAIVDRRLGNPTAQPAAPADIVELARSLGVLAACARCRGPLGDLDQEAIGLWAGRPGCLCSSCHSAISGSLVRTGPGDFWATMRRELEAMKETA